MLLWCWLQCVQEVVTPFYIVSYYIKWDNYFLDTRYFLIDLSNILVNTLSAIVFLPSIYAGSTFKTVLLVRNVKTFYNETILLARVADPGGVDQDPTVNNPGSALGKQPGFDLIKFILYF